MLHLEGDALERPDYLFLGWPPQGAAQVSEGRGGQITQRFTQSYTRYTDMRTVILGVTAFSRINKINIIRPLLQPHL